MKYTRNLGQHYSPLFLLNALAAAVLALGFFMFLTIMMPERGFAVPACLSLWPLLEEMHPIRLFLLILGLSGSVYFSYEFVQLSLWNMAHYKKWSSSEGYTSFLQTHMRSLMMALPLIVGVAANLALLGSVVFIPYLWEIRDYLLPLAFAGFCYIGFYATRMHLRFASRLYSEPKLEGSHSVGSLCNILSFTAVAHGFSLIAEASQWRFVFMVAALACGFFLLYALIRTFAFLVSQLQGPLYQKTMNELVIFFAGLTVTIAALGISYYRLHLALSLSLGIDMATSGMFTFYGALFLLTLLTVANGVYAMKLGLWKEKYLTGKDFSAGNYLVVCAIISLALTTQFLINGGLFSSELMDGFSLSYIAVYLPVFALYAVAVRLFLLLNARLFGHSNNAQTKAVTK